MNEAQAAELEAALNRLDPLVVRRAIDALQNHPLSRHYRIQSFATGAATPGDGGTSIQLSVEGNYLFRVAFSDSAGGLNFSSGSPQPSFIELTLSPDSMTWFATALGEVLQRQGWGGL